MIKDFIFFGVRVKHLVAAQYNLATEHVKRVNAQTPTKDRFTDDLVKCIEICALIRAENGQNPSNVHVRKTTSLLARYHFKSLDKIERINKFHTPNRNTGTVEWIKSSSKISLTAEQTESCLATHNTFSALSSPSLVRKPNSTSNHTDEHEQSFCRPPVMSSPAATPVCARQCKQPKSSNSKPNVPKKVGSKNTKKRILKPRSKRHKSPVNAAYVTPKLTQPKQSVNAPLRVNRPQRPHRPSNTIPLIVSAPKRCLPPEWFNEQLMCEYCSRPMNVVDVHRSHLLYNCPAGDHQLDYSKRNPKRRRIQERLASLANVTTQVLKHNQGTAREQHANSNVP